MEAVTLAHAYYISSSSTSANALRLQSALASAPFTLEWWPAIMGGPQLLSSHSGYLRRGVEPHLLSPRCARRSLPCTLANISSWGQVGIYCSHLSLLEHIASTYGRSAPNATLVILQDDVALSPSWRGVLQQALERLHRRHTGWARCLLAWFGSSRPDDCDDAFCRVRPPAGPVDGKRYYHGLQASVLRARAAECLVHCLARTRIKAIDSLLVGCETSCEQVGTTWALREQTAFGGHAGGHFVHAGS
jgi:hypothetical protein